MSNYYAADFDPWVHNIRGIGTMLAQMPMMRARMGAMQQLANLRAEQIGTQQTEQQKNTALAYESGAHGRLYEAQAGDAEDQTASGNRLSSALKKVVTNPGDTDAAGDAISEFGHYFKKNPEQAAKGMGSLLSQFMALRGNTNFATQGSLQGNAASIANNLANNERIINTPRVVPDNSVLVDPGTGSPISTSPQKLNAGQRLFTAGDDNVTLATQPTVQGAPLPPKSSAADTVRAQLAAALTKGGNTIDPSITGTNAASGLKIYDALVASGIVPGVGSAAAPTSGTASPGAAAPINVNSFNSEEEARGAGFKTGDVVYLNGVGKVRLR